VAFGIKPTYTPVSVPLPVENHPGVPAVKVPPTVAVTGYLSVVVFNVPIVTLSVVLLLISKDKSSAAGVVIFIKIS